MKRTYSGAASGKGAVYAWEGNRNVGSGRMEITEASPSSKVMIQLDFIKPFEGHNITEFTLQPAGGATNVTWTMQGPSPFITKVMGVFINMDKMIGRDFEAGLANLKSVAEGKRQTPISRDTLSTRPAPSRSRPRAGRGRSATRVLMARRGRRGGQAAARRRA